MPNFAIIIDEMHPLLTRMGKRLNERGAQVVFLPWQDIVINVGGKNLETYDAIYLDRMGESKKSYLAQLLALESVGALIVNRPSSYLNARNKALSTLTFHKHNFPIPNTWILHSFVQLQKLIQFGVRYVAKGVEGVCAKEVFSFFANQIPELELQRLFDRDGQVVLQEYIDNPKHFIWRVDIVHNEVKVCNKRYAFSTQDGFAICNGTNGGKVEFFPAAEFSCAACKLALAATMAFGLDVAGVDLIEDASGNLYILEVNPEPDITLDRYEFPDAIADFLYETSMNKK